MLDETGIAWERDLVSGLKMAEKEVILNTNPSILNDKFMSFNTKFTSSGNLALP